MIITTSSHFINEFRNIQEDKVGLRKYSLYKLLKASQLNSEELGLLAENLQPQNYLEIIFHADILIYFKITSALLELFKKGQDVYVSKIIKQPWFFEEVFKNVSSNQLVEEVLPTLSYSVKVKLLKKLLPILLPKQIDEIFDNLLKKYGLFFATKVLTGCSTEKIRNVLTTHDVKLSSRDLKLLYKKDFNLIETYFEERKLRKYDDVSTDEVYKILAENNPEYFWKLLKSYQPNVKLGRRITTKLLKDIEKQEIISDPKTYIRYFKNERMVRILNHEGHLPEFYKNLYPEDVPDIQNESILKTILRYYPKRKRYDLFRTTFEQVYNEDILSNFKFIDTSLLELIEEKEFRVKWAHLKFDETGNNQYLEYYDAKEAIPLIQEKINLTSDLTHRNNLLCSLLKCCDINEDMVALEKVLHYFYKRHRNAVFQSRDEFIDSFKKLFCKKFAKFTETIWKYFIEIAMIDIADNMHKFFFNAELIGKYVEYLYKKNETEAENLIRKFIPKTDLFYFIPGCEEFVTDINIQKKIVTSSYKFSKTENLDTLTKTNLYIMSFVRRLLEFNKQHPEHKIVFDENMQNDIRDCFKVNENHYDLILLILPTLRKNDLDGFERELLTLSWEYLFRHSYDETQIAFLNWYCTYQPATIAQHFDNIVKMFPRHFYRERSPLWYRKFSYLGLDDAIEKRCLNELSGTSEIFYLKSNCVLLLSYQYSIEDYIKLGEDYNLFPTNLKLDTEDEEVVTKFRLQKSYIDMFKNTQNPSKYLPLILEKYCQGDFLQVSLSPVYKAFCKIPEESLKPYLKNILERKNISLTKHAVTLACNVLDKNAVMHTLKHFENAENKSFKKSVFGSVLKYFSKSPTNEVFDILLVWLQFLTEQDLESLKSLFDTKIDKNYLEEYLRHAWNLVKRFEDNSEIHDIRRSCLKTLNNANFDKLANDLCKDVIQKYFLSEPEMEEIYLFVITFLLCNKQDEDFAYVFQIISNFKSHHQYEFKPSNTKKIKKFVKVFVTIFHEKEVELYVLEKLMKHWESAFLPHEAFEEHLLLKFMVFWKCSHNSENFASEVMHYLEHIRVEYDDILLNFASVLAHFLDFIDEKVKLNLFLSMLETSDAVLASSLVIELIRIKHDFICDGDRIRKKYSKVDAALKQTLDNYSVKLKYNLLLREFSL